MYFSFFFQAEDGIRDLYVTGVQTCALPIYPLGRGQEIAHVLCQGGIRTAVHGAIAKFIPVYEDYGYQFPGWEPYDARATRSEERRVGKECRSRWWPYQ